MTTVRELHEQAMTFAQNALVLRERGKHAEAIELARQATALEVKAASVLEKTREDEPTRSILYQSAASLALQSEQLELAERLIADGLSGFPQPRLRHELKALLDRVDFQLHLREQGSMLSGDRFLIVLKGRAVGEGSVAYSEVHKRMEAGISLLKRASLRLQNQPYQPQGKAPTSLNLFEPVLHAPRAGSFSIEIELAMKDASTRSLFTSSDKIIADVVTSVGMVQRDEYDNLRSRIPDEPYFNHFCAMARELAPDGANVSMVDISGAGEEVAFTRTRSDINRSPATTNEQSRVIQSEHVGTLVRGNSYRKSTIGLQDDDGQMREVLVREGLDELVRNYFGVRVRITVTGQGKNATLDSLDEADL